MRRRFVFLALSAAVLGAGGCAALKSSAQLVEDARRLEAEGSLPLAIETRRRAADVGFERRDAANANWSQIGMDYLTMERYDDALAAFTQADDHRNLGRVHFLKKDYAAARKELEVFVRALLTNYHYKGADAYERGYRPEIYQWLWSALTTRQADPSVLMGAIREDRYDPKQTGWTWNPGDKKTTRPEYVAAIDLLFEQALANRRANKPFRLPGVFHDLMKANPRLPSKFEKSGRYVLLRLWDEEGDSRFQVKLLKGFLQSTGLLDAFAQRHSYIRKAGTDEEQKEEKLPEDTYERLRREMVVLPGQDFLIEQLKIKID